MYVCVYVLGCSTRSTRNSVKYAQDGRIVYPGGPIGLVLDKSTRTQDFCCAHADDITALDVHIGRYAASSSVWISEHFIHRYFWVLQVWVWL